MHALLLDSRHDRLDRLQIAFLEAGIHVTGSSSLAVAECCLRRAMVDLVLIDEGAAGAYAGDLVAMAERRNGRVVTLVMAAQPDETADAWSPRMASLHGVLDHDADPAQVARMARAALSSRGEAAAVARPEAAPGAAEVAKAPPVQAATQAQTQTPTQAPVRPEAAAPAQASSASAGAAYPALKVHPALAAQRAAEAEARKAEIDRRHAQAREAEADRMEQARSVARQRAQAHAAAVRAAAAEAAELRRRQQEAPQPVAQDRVQPVPPRPAVPRYIPSASEAAAEPSSTQAARATVAQVAPIQGNNDQSGGVQIDNTQSDTDRLRSALARKLAQGATLSGSRDARREQASVAVPQQASQPARSRLVGGGPERPYPPLQAEPERAPAYLAQGAAQRRHPAGLQPIGPSALPSARGGSVAAEAAPRPEPVIDARPAVQHRAQPVPPQAPRVQSVQPHPSAAPAPMRVTPAAPPVQRQVQTQAQTRVQPQAPVVQAAAPQPAPLQAPSDDGQPIFQSSRRRLGVTSGNLMSA